MEYVTIKNLEKYHPGYKDRNLSWAKIYFKLVTADGEFQLIEEEIDKWRFVAMICLELANKKPLPNSNRFWKLCGFNIEERDMGETLSALAEFVDVLETPEELHLPNQQHVSRIGYIYFFQAVESGLIKIGFSMRPRERLLELERQTSRTLKLLYQHQGTMALERVYHNSFKEFEVSPEWYRPETKLINFVSTLEKKYGQVIENANVTHSPIIPIQSLGKERNVDKEEEKNKSRGDKSTYVHMVSVFEDIWQHYPSRTGKKNALRHFIATVRTDDEAELLRKALKNYLASYNVDRGYVKNGSTWFNEWRDWLEPTEYMMKGPRHGNEQTSTPGSQGARASYRIDPDKARADAQDLEEAIRRDREERSQRP